MHSELYRAADAYCNQWLKKGGPGSGRHPEGGSTVEHKQIAENHHASADAYDQQADAAHNAGNDKLALHYQRMAAQYHQIGRMHEQLAAEKVEKIHKPHKQKHGDKWRVVDTDGKIYGTHDTETEADAQVSALYANKTE